MELKDIGSNLKNQKLREVKANFICSLQNNEDEKKDQKILVRIVFGKLIKKLYIYSIK